MTTDPVGFTDEPTTTEPLWPLVTLAALTPCAWVAASWLGALIGEALR